MRCLVTGDLHFNLRQFDWIGTVADRYDAVILTGDLLDMTGHQSRHQQLRQVGDYLRQWRGQTHLLVVSGNHDAVDADHRADWLEVATAAGCFVDGDTVVFDAASFTLCPWRDDPLTEAELAQLLRTAPVPSDRPWIWVHHEPPAGAAVSWSGRTARGSAALAQLVRRQYPQFVLSGHIHDAPFVEGGTWIDRMGATQLVNHGRQPGDVPAHVVLDFAQDEVHWIAVGARDTRPLAANRRPSLPEARGPVPAFG
ncbi:MAG: phosphohydrolase [Geminicoccaceae bacterium]|nr:MAG: phosphohydrolase [Geminicoccaceae bacterium]